MSSNKEYKIEKITDLLLVPVDKLDECIAEIKSWCLFARSIEDACGNNMQTTGFTWVDDGVRGLSGFDITIDICKEDTK